MKLGFFGINMGACAQPAIARRVAQAAEQAGFESLWVGEHVVLPDPRQPPSPLPPDYPMLDPVVALSFLAAATTTIRLGTGIIILPQRNPLVLAKQLASLDQASSGRLIFGIGIGYLKAEFDALGVPFAHKGARTEEYLAAMEAIWSMAKPEYKGRFVNFAGVQAMPQPVQQPHPEIVFGGRSAAAYSRTARLARGWYGYALDPKAAARCIESLRRECQAAGRRFEDLEISISPLSPDGKFYSENNPLTLDDARRFAELGVQRLIVTPPGRVDEGGLLRMIEHATRNLVGKV